MSLLEVKRLNTEFKIGVGTVQAMPGQKNGGQQGHSQNKRKKRQQFRHSAALLVNCSCCRQRMPNFRSLCRDCQPAYCLAVQGAGPYSPKADAPRKGSFGMYHNKVELCGINTAQLPVLTEREKAQLLRRVKQFGLTEDDVTLVNMNDD